MNTDGRTACQRIRVIAKCLAKPESIRLAGIEAPIFKRETEALSAETQSRSVEWLWVGRCSLYPEQRYSKNNVVFKDNSRYTLSCGMDTITKKLGKNIRKIRLAKAMTQGDLCRKLGVDRSYVSNVESGKKNPTLLTIERISKALGVSVETLVK